MRFPYFAVGYNAVAGGVLATIFALSTERWWCVAGAGFHAGLAASLLIYWAVWREA